ncbi:MAG TPA: Ig-like domain-containing protein, partial [Myxococcaceae bacterium]|nr:Ig-like domain-containing protein [Myxococcaceae bacterium]
MRELELARRNRRTSWKLSSSLLLLLSIGGLGCDVLPGKKPPPPGEDKTAPTRVRVTGGVLPEEVITGSRTLEASAEDDSGRVAKVEFLISDTLACTDATARDSGATFSCEWDSSATSPGAYVLTATAYDAAGNAASSEPIAFTIPV